MVKLVSLFNHKGGVSKTTTTFNLGWALAMRGKRVRIVDADPQCNLTGIVLGFGGDNDYEAFYTSHPRSDLYTCLHPVFQGTQAPIQPGDLISTQNPQLFLLAGRTALSEAETQLAVALTTAAAIPALRNLPGSMGVLLRQTANHHNIDIVLIDMSPSVGALNQCLLMASDYFNVPTFPDYFCDQAIRSLARILPHWHTQVATFRDLTMAYPLPGEPPVFIGMISQRFRPRGAKPSAAFQSWIDRINQTVAQVLVPSLQPSRMTISYNEFAAAAPEDVPYNLISIADFNTLIAQSQEHNVPVFALTDEQIGKTGIVLETMKENRDKFRSSFNQLARTVMELTHV